MTDPALDQLQNRLADGFRDARVPSNVDEIADDFEVPAVHDLVGKHWTEVPFESIVRVRWDLEWFHRLGIRHYLPALMLAALRDSEVAELVIQYLERDSGQRGELWPDEMRAVRAWLQYMRDQLKNEDAAKALAAYWENPPITALDDERVALFRRAREVFAPGRAPHEATELAAAVTQILEWEGGAYRQHVAAASPHDAAKRAPVVRALSIEQLAFLVDFLDYSRRRRPDVDDEANVQFWRAQLVARGA